MKFKRDRDRSEFRLRRDAIRDAYFSARESRGGECSDASVLREELSKRGINDLSEDELDVLVMSLSSPNRAIVRRFSQKFGSVRQAVGVLRDLGNTEPPGWTMLPTGTAQIEWRTDQGEIVIERAAMIVASTSNTIIRLFSELPHFEHGSEHPELRPFSCWITRRPANGLLGVKISVNVGRLWLVDLPDAWIGLAERLLDAHGKQTNALEIIGEIEGDRVDGGILRLILPDRP